MAQIRKIMICLPNSLLEEVDGLARLEKRNRSAFIREAMRLYIRERRRHQLTEQMMKGYVQMGKMNLQLAEEAIRAEYASAEAYERLLAEDEKTERENSAGL